MAKLLEFVSTLIRVGEKVYKLVENEKAKQWLVDLDSTLDQINGSKSLREKIEAAKRLGDLLRRI